MSAYRAVIFYLDQEGFCESLDRNIPVKENKHLKEESIIFESRDVQSAQVDVLFWWAYQNRHNMEKYNHIVKFRIYDFVPSTIRDDGYLSPNGRGLFQVEWSGHLVNPKEGG